MGDEAGIAAAVAVGDRTSEYAGDIIPLMIVKPFRGDKGYLDAEVVHDLATFLRMLGDQGDR